MTTRTYVLRVIDTAEECGTTFWGPYATRAAAEVIANDVDEMTGGRLEAFIEPVDVPETGREFSAAQWICEAMS